MRTAAARSELNGEMYLVLCTGQLGHGRHSVPSWIAPACLQGQASGSCGGCQLRVRLLCSDTLKFGGASCAALQLHSAAAALSHPFPQTADEPALRRP
jgi:hypothetical protein